jgi:hypothetical protein
MIKVVEKINSDKYFDLEGAFPLFLKDIIYLLKTEVVHS